MNVGIATGLIYIKHNRIRFFQSKLHENYH
jgi:hypothetical protein